LAIQFKCIKQNHQLLDALATRSVVCKAQRPENKW